VDEVVKPGASRADAYRRAGVDIEAGSRALDLMRAAVRSTFGPQVMADVGYFGGMFALEGTDTVLVASADGVGTKLKLTTLLGAYRYAGQDIVNHCINDILMCGAKPIFFLDYLAAASLVPERLAEVVAGMADACRAAGCALLGGETAELPGIYATGEFDVAGFIVGTVERPRLVLGQGVRPGDIALALPSSGLHTNGFSLARSAFGISDADPEGARSRLGRFEPSLRRTLGEALVEPHRSYLPEIGALVDLPEQPIKGMAHITGGGLVDNIPRALPDSCSVELDTSAWEVPPLFRLIQEEGGVAEAEMARVFNMGLGVVMFAAPEDVPLVEEQAPDLMRVGRVVARTGDDRLILAGTPEVGRS
jgi:phosphoribosylformylglycinamidine cyclo-ligase